LYRAARKIRPYRAKLGHRQQGLRAQRFQRVHELGIKGKDLYLLHELCKRMEYPELKRAVCEQCEAFEARVVLIEDKASGTQLIQELVADGLHGVTPLPAAIGQGDAHARPDRDDRERLYASAQRGGMACRIPARVDRLSEGRARRSGRLDAPVARLVQASRRRPHLQRREAPALRQLVSEELIHGVRHAQEMTATVHRKHVFERGAGVA